MIYATEMNDGSVAITTLVPIAIIDNGKCLDVQRFADGKLYLGDGRLAVVLPVPLEDLQPDSIEGCEIVFPAMDEIIAKWPDEMRKNALEYKQISAAGIPKTRAFRNAWKLNGSGIGHDMAKARDIHRDRIRKAREPELKRLDVEYLKADEAGNEVKKHAITKRKKVLRDAPADTAIGSAKTIEELESIRLPI